MASSPAPTGTITSANRKPSFAAGKASFKKHFDQFARDRPRVESEHNQQHPGEMMPLVSAVGGFEGLTSETACSRDLWEAVCHHMVHVAKKETGGGHYAFGTIDVTINGMFDMARKKFGMQPNTPAWEFFKASDPHADRCEQRAWWVGVKDTVAEHCFRRSEQTGEDVDHSVSPIGEVRL